MNLLPSEVSLQMRFDAFCKKVITYTNYKLLREGQKRREQGYVFSDFEEGELEQYYYTYDTYPALALKIELEHIRVFIENEMLYQALLLLPKKRLEIIILSFFADMTDKEIGKTILMPKSSVQYNRNVALQYIRKMMEVHTEVNEKQNELFGQNVRKSIFGSKQKLKTKTILLAVSGDTEALMEVVDTYQPYIEKLSMRVVMDENGHCREMVDETVKRSLEVGLIAAIMKFHPYI